MKAEAKELYNYITTNPVFEGRYENLLATMDNLNSSIENLVKDAMHIYQIGYGNNAEIFDNVDFEQCVSAIIEDIKERNEYVSISRPVGEYDKRMLQVVQNNLKYFNTKKRNGIITVEHYVANGDRWQMLKDGKCMLSDMSLNELYYAVAAIIRYKQE